MSRKTGNDPAGGFLLLLLFLLTIHWLSGAAGSVAGDGAAARETVFVEVSGDVPHPGVYAFETPPHATDLVTSAGGPREPSLNAPPPDPRRFRSGASVRFVAKGRAISFSEGEMSAFYRVTLGLPVLLNRESSEGLTAVPGIGPKTAEAIVRERARTGGFREIEDLRSVPGIGPALLKTIRPWVALEEGGPAGSPSVPRSAPSSRG